MFPSDLTPCGGSGEVQSSGAGASISSQRNQTLHAAVGVKIELICPGVWTGALLEPADAAIYTITGWANRFVLQPHTTAISALSWEYCKEMAKDISKRPLDAVRQHTSTCSSMLQTAFNHKKAKLNKIDSIYFFLMYFSTKRNGRARVIFLFDPTKWEKLGRYFLVVSTL